MSTKLYCDRCGDSMPYPCAAVNLNVYDDPLSGYSFSLTVTARIINHARATTDACQKCVRELIAKSQEPEKS